MGFFGLGKGKGAADPGSVNFVDPGFLRKAESALDQEFHEEVMAGKPGFISEDKTVFICTKHNAPYGAQWYVRKSVKDLHPKKNAVGADNSYIASKTFAALRELGIEQVQVHPQGNHPVVFTIHNYYFIVAPVVEMD